LLIAAPSGSVFAEPSGLEAVLSVLTYAQEQLVRANTNALDILTSSVVSASPKSVATSFFMGLLRRSAPRNDKSFIAFALVTLQAAAQVGLLGNELSKGGSLKLWDNEFLSNERAVYITNLSSRPEGAVTAVL
jgi:hypothetical protein